MSKGTTDGTVGLTLGDCELILQSLEHTREAFSRYAYPTDTLRVSRLDEVSGTIGRVRQLRRQLKEAGHVPS